MSDPEKDTAEATASGKRKRHRRRHGRGPRGLLKARRRKVRKQSRKVTKALQHSDLSTPAGERELKKSIGSLRSNLRHLRKEVQREGKQRRNKPVVGALRDLDVALARLAKAGSVDDPNAQMVQLYHGMKALNNAQKNAKAAGRDWTI